jgi:UDP-2,4-diacetamido-2,4,6-trideoxy-beta-L-altropyranose hydrolase
MSRRASALCDGRGARRSCLAIASLESAKDDAEVMLRPALNTDAGKMLAWQSHPQTRQYSRTVKVPDRDSHFSWVAARLTDPDCLLNIILHAGDPAGVIRLDRLRKESCAVPRWEVSIYIAPDKYGLGLGLAALRLGRRLLPDGEFKAEVLPENAASHALFRKAGYEWRDGFYWLPPVVEQEGFSIA